MRKYNIILLFEACINPLPATLPLQVVEAVQKITQEHGDIAEFITTSLGQCNADLAKSIQHYQDSYRREFEYRS